MPTCCDKQAFFFVGATSKLITYTSDYVERIGPRPNVSVYLENDDGTYYQTVFVQVTLTGAPIVTQVTVDLGGGPATGFVLLS